MLTSQLQGGTVYLYTGVVELKVRFVQKTTKGNYKFEVTEGQHKGVTRPLSEAAVQNFIQPLNQ